MKHKHADLIHAYADGAEIQYRYSHNKEWRDSDTHTWCKTTEYRIKPTPPRKPRVRQSGLRFFDCEGGTKTIEFIEAGWTKLIPHDGSEECPVDPDATVVCKFDDSTIRMYSCARIARWLQVTAYSQIMEED